MPQTDDLWNEFMKTLFSNASATVDSNLPKLASKIALFFTEKANALLENSAIAEMFEHESTIEWIGERIDTLLENEILSPEELAEVSALFFLLLLTPLEDDGDDGEESESDAA